MKIDAKKLKELLQGIIIEQATRECSGRDWGNKALHDLDKVINEP